MKTHTSIFILFFSLILSLAVTSCDESGGKGRRSKKDTTTFHMDGVPANEASGPIIHIIGLSPAMAAEDKPIVKAQADAEYAWIVKSAPEGSESQFFNALTGAPVGAYRAVPGSAGIRLKAQIRAKGAISAFLEQAPPPRIPTDSRIHLPKFASAIAMKHYPAGTMVTVFANPNFITEGKDKNFCTHTGYVPSDGLLAEDPRTCLFSTRGKEKSLEGQTWYWGFPSSVECFIDNSHQVGIQRFLHVYLKSQGATLAHFGPTFPAAAMAMRDGHTEPLSDEEPDLTAKPGMIKVIQQDDPPVTTIEPPMKKGETTEGPETGAKTVEVPKTAPVAKPKLDTFGNPLDQDLIAKGSMKGARILWVTTDRDESLEKSPLIACLAEKGFVVKTVIHPLPKLATWKELLSDTDQVWLFACGVKNEMSSAHATALVEAWKRGVDVCLEGDNDPLFHEVNSILAMIAPGAKLSGDYKAQAVIEAQKEPSGIGFDGKHAIFYGIKNFWEGVTTSHVTLSGGLVPVCRDSSKQVLMAVLDEGGKTGRLIVHGGYTTFYPDPFIDKPGAARLGVNMAGWLAGIDKASGAEVAEVP